MTLHYCIAILAFTCTMPLAAQSVIYQDDSDFPRITPLNPTNVQFLTKQRARVDSITRKHFGRQLAGGNTNKSLLQRIIDEQVVAATEKLDLQGMGVVLGDLFVDTDKNLVWKLYEDDLGVSHAVCVNDTKHCIFPVTMISRRIEGGAPVDVNRLYRKGLDSMRDYLPKLPYSD